MIEPPFLLFLADAESVAMAKTAFGLAYWRPERCLGELRYPETEVTVGLRPMTPVEAVAAGAKTLIVGYANSGGILDPRSIETLHEALDAGLDVASGMHTRLREQPSLREAAARLGRTLHDVREPPNDLPVGTGKRRSGRRLLTVGTDCSVGKMFTSLAIERAMHDRGVAATFRATGQTGILIAGSGIPVDAVVSDFVSGAVEVLSPDNAPEHWDVIEGQGSLFHPSFAAVTLGITHGAQPDVMVLCHEAGRTRMRGGVDHPMPSLAECVEAYEDAARLTHPDPKIVACSINTAPLEESAARAFLDDLAADLGLPATDPVRFGIDPVVDAVLTR